jgi:hypothetical protein
MEGYCSILGLALEQLQKEVQSLRETHAQSMPSNFYILFVSLFCFLVTSYLIQGQAFEQLQKEVQILKETQAQSQHQPGTNKVLARLE